MRADGQSVVKIFGYLGTMTVYPSYSEYTYALAVIIIGIQLSPIRREPENISMVIGRNRATIKLKETYLYLYQVRFYHL